MAKKNLKQKAASGMVWTALQKYSTMIIHFISGIILARLLTPYDYGCIGMLSIFMVLADVIINGGFGSALIFPIAVFLAHQGTCTWTSRSIIIARICSVSSPLCASLISTESMLCFTVGLPWD